MPCWGTAGEYSAPGEDWPESEVVEPTDRFGELPQGACVGGSEEYVDDVDDGTDIVKLAVGTYG